MTFRQCAYIKVDGNQCGGPAVRESKYCHHHENLKSCLDNRLFILPALDDSNAIQVATMQVMNAMIAGKISRADAYALFYGLYLAKSNLKNVTLVPPSPDVVAEQIAAAKAEGREEYRREQGDFDENGEPISLSAYLLRELRATEPEGLSQKPPAASPSTEPGDSSRQRKAL